MKGWDKYKSHRVSSAFYAAVLLCAMFNAFTGIAQARSTSRNVLILNSYSDRNMWTKDIVTGIEGVLNEDSHILFTEYMDTKKVSSQEYFEQLYDLYALKYHDIPFDVIITTDDNAYQFALNHHDELFKNVPVVFCGVSQFDPSQITGLPVTGVLEKEPFEETLAVALKLQPKTKTVYVICDHTLTASISLERLKWILAENHPAVSYELLRDLTADEMSAAMANLPEDAIALSISWWHDSTGRKIDPEELIRILSGANRPVFASSARLVGFGSFGGKCSIALDHGRIAGEMARQVLSGADARSMPIVDDQEQVSVYMFDHLQLQKYQIPQSLVPEDAVIINAPKRFDLFDKQNLLGLLGGIAGFLGLVFSLVLFILHYRSIHRTAQDKEQQFRNLVETTSDWIWEVDAESHFTYSSPQVEGILGYRPEEIIGKSVYDLMTPDEADRVDKIFASIHAQQIPFDRLVNTNLHKDGHEMIMETSGVPIFDKQGRFMGYRGIDRDITERKAVDQALLDNQAALLKAQHIASLHFYDWDFRNDVVKASEGLKHFFGCKPDEDLTFELVASRIHPEDREQFVREDLESRTEGVPFNMDYRVLLPDGTIRWAHDQSEITVDDQGDKARMFGVIQDITERKAVDQALRESQAKLNAILDHHYQLTGLLDHDGRLLAANKTALDFAGLEEKDVLGKYFWDSPWWEPSQKGDLQDMIKRAAGGQFVRVETTHLDRAGQIRQIDFSLTPVLDDEGNVIYIVPEGRDITELKEHEQALMFTQFSLDHAGEAAYWVDRDENLIYVNEKACQSLDYAHDELMQMKVSQIDPHYLPEEWAKHWDDLRQEGTRRFEGRHQRKDGTVLPVEITSTFMTYEGKEYICSAVRDITDLKAAEKQRDELVQKLQFTQFAFDHAGEAAHWVTREETFVYVNEMACEMLGYTYDEFMGMLIPTIDPFYEHKDWLIFWDQMRQEGRRCFEARHKHKDGTVIPVEITSNFVTYDDKEYICSFIRDISDRKAAEKQREELIQQLQLTQFAVDHAGDAAYWMGPDAKFIYVNELACETLGYSRDEILEMSVPDIDPDFPVDKWGAHWDHMRHKGVNRFESHHKRKDGVVFPVEIMANFVTYEDHEYICAYAHNITERKKAEQALQESENKHRLIFTSASDAIFILNGDRFIDCNPQAVKLLGCEDASEILSKMPADFSPVYQEDGRLSAEVIQEKHALVLEGKPQRFPWVHRKKDRSSIYTEVSLSAIQLKGKIHIQAAAHDVTRERLAEIEQERLLKELQSKNEELQSIVFIASHDLRSPLVNIRGFTGELEKSLRRLEALLKEEPLSEAAKERLKVLFEDDIPESMKFINAGNQKMDVLLNGLLRLSRVGTTQVHLTKLDMDQMLKGIVNNFHFRIRRDDIEITYDKPMPACRGDVVLVNQVFTNLIDNAIKYRDLDRNTTIHVSAVVKPEGVVYCVADNGIGIDPKHHKKVFEVFHRLDPSKGEGEGLGLTIVARILDRQQGRIWIESEPDVGTSVYVQLPGV